MATTIPDSSNPPVNTPSGSLQTSSFVVELTDLEVVRAFASGPGQFVTTVLPAPVAGDTAATLAVEWSSARHQLALHGANPVTLQLVERFVTDLTPTGHALFVAATDHSMGWKWMRGSAREARVFSRADRLPVLSPIVEELSHRCGVVGAAIDRSGADILVLSSSGESRSESIAGDQLFIHRVVSGGWSQRRRQARTDLTWERNAGQMAQRMIEAAATVGADHFVLTGDDRAVALVGSALPRGASRVVRAGGRNEPGTPERLGRVVTEVAAEARQDLRRTTFERMAEELARLDRAVAGPVATLERLTAGAVETLLVSAELDDDRRAWFGDDPSEVSMFASALSDVAGRGRLADVAIIAALRTEAGVVVVEEGELDLPQGIGALLRHTSSASTGSAKEVAE